MSVTITQGTETKIYSKLNAGTEIQVVKLDIGAGTAVADFGGTINRVTDLLKGTVSTVGLTHADAFATVVSTGTNVMGTIKAAVAGSVIYVTDLVISAGSSTNVEIASGGTSTPIIGTMYFAVNGGAVMNFRTPVATASGSALVYKQSTAVSPLSITCLGYVK